jgi:hypothetical protein
MQANKKQVGASGSGSKSNVAPEVAEMLKRMHDSGKSGPPFRPPPAPPLPTNLPGKQARRQSSLSEVAQAIAPGARALSSSLKYRAERISPASVGDDSDWDLPLCEGLMQQASNVTLEGAIDADCCNICAARIGADLLPNDFNRVNKGPAKLTSVDASTQTEHGRYVVVDTSTHTIVPRKNRVSISSISSSATCVETTTQSSSKHEVSEMPGTWPAEAMIPNVNMSTKPTTQGLVAMTSSAAIGRGDRPAEIVNYIRDRQWAPLPPIDSSFPLGVGYMPCVEDDKLSEKYGLIESFFRHDKLYASAKLFGVECVDGEHQLTTAVGVYPYMHNTRLKCEMSMSKDGGGCASLLAKGFLLSMIEASGNTISFDNDWSRSRGTKRVIDKWRLSSKEYELLRILNQPFPSLSEGNTVWHRICVPSCELDVGRPKGISITNYWDTFSNLVGKLGLINEWKIVVKDMLGLAEYLSACHATKCRLDAQSNGFTTLRVYDAVGCGLGMNANTLLIASLIQGDELCVIRNQCQDDGSIEQWDCLLRHSLIICNGRKTEETQQLSRAILCAFGYESVVFPSNPHCGMAVDDKVVPWLNSLLVCEDTKPTRMLGGFPIVKGCARVMELKSLDTYAIKVGWASYNDLIASADYKAIMITYDGRRPVIHHGVGKGKHWLMINDGNISVITNFGRKRHQLSLNEHYYGGLFDKL